MNRHLKFFTAICGLLSVAVFVIAFMLLGFLHSDFNFFDDYISKLGGIDEPNALFWNIFGFGAVGVFLATFGWLFGLCRDDRILGACLMVAGAGFALAAIPTDFADPKSPLSTAHFMSICISLAGFCVGMARLTSSKSTDRDRT
ncbi:MAG: DUF998 domain-containing protein, partial [Planctomycetota bacterium]